MERKYMSLKLTPESIGNLLNAQHLLFQSIFISGKRPRGQINCIMSSDLKDVKELTTGVSIIFLTPRLKQSYVEGHLILAYVQYNPVWTSFVNTLRENDEIEIVWLVDSHTTPEMLKVGLHGDSIRLVCYRGKKQRHFLMTVTISKNDDNRPVKFLTPLVEEKDLEQCEEMGESSDD